MENFYEILKTRFGIEPPAKGEQDWEFTCGSSEQTNGYIDFYLEFSNDLSEEQKYLVVNMILQGYEDILAEAFEEEESAEKKYNSTLLTDGAAALKIGNDVWFDGVSGSLSDSETAMLSSLWTRIEEILISEKDLHAQTIRYWASLNIPLKDAFYIAKPMRELVKRLDLEWVEVKTEEDAEELNNLYDHFEDALITDMNYVSGDYVDEALEGHMIQKNDLKIRFQRLDTSPFSIELWFLHTKKVRFWFANPSDQSPSDILEGKVCLGEKSIFFTTWEDFDPMNEAHQRLEDVTYVEAEGLKWRIVEA